MTLGRSDRAKQCELLRALSDDHLEGVEDQETTHEQRHVAKGEQECVDEVERLLETGQLLLGRGFSIDHGRVLRSDLLDGGHQRLG